MKFFGFIFLTAVTRLCHASIHSVTCHQSHFDILPNLHDCNIISGGLMLDSFAGPVHLPNLRKVDSISFQSGNITSISLPNLVTATDFLSFWDLPQLTKIELPKLVSRRPTILLVWLPRLEHVEMPKLAVSSGIKIKATPKLKELDLPSLRRIKDGNFSGYFQMEDGPRVLSLPSLVEVDGMFNVTGKIDAIRLPSMPKSLNDEIISSRGRLKCAALRQTWRNTENPSGELRCEPLGDNILVPLSTVKLKERLAMVISILRVLITASVAAFALVAFYGGSQWDVWLIVSVYAGVWGLVSIHRDSRWGWTAPVL